MFRSETGDHWCSYSYDEELIINCPRQGCYLFRWGGGGGGDHWCSLSYDEEWTTSTYIVACMRAHARGSGALFLWFLDTLRLIPRPFCRKTWDHVASFVTISNIHVAP